MKRILECLVLAAALPALAFDSEDWLAKRAMLRYEAVRLAELYTNCLKKVETPAEKVKFAIETFPNGAVKSEFFAERAMYFHQTPYVWAAGVVVRKLDTDGTELSRLEADRCVFDRQTKSGWADGRAKVVHGKTTFVGNDVYFSSAEGYVSAFDGADVVSTDIKSTGGVVK